MAPGSVSQPVVVLAPVKPGPMPLRLHDGSIAAPLDATSTLTVREDSPTRVALALERGRARFEVVPRSERPFVVQMGEVTVSVLGTIFAIERVADRIGVSVERGTVRVDWQVGDQLLHAGQSGWFPPVQIRAPVAESQSEQLAASARPTAEAANSPFDPTATPPQPEPQRGRTPPHPPRRRGLENLPKFRAIQSQPGQSLPGERGRDFRQGLLEPPAADRGERRGEAVPAAKDRGPGVGDERRALASGAEELLAAADAARSAGRRGESVALLQRLLHEQRDDARAPLAAFTLGRILLMEMGQPGEAALAFAEARALAPTGPLAEDALAREAEAWNKAGDTGKAGARAREYLRLFPHGRRAEFLQGLVGIP
jgi:transmembrane sensor